MATLLLGEAEQTSPVSSANGNAKFDVPAGSIFSANDTLFTSGSLRPLLHHGSLLAGSS